MIDTKMWTFLKNITQNPDQVNPVLMKIPKYISFKTKYGRYG